MSHIPFAIFPRAANTKRQARPLTGGRVLVMLVAFFGTVAAVNALMIHYALSTFRGEVADHPYEVGLAYNSEIEAARAQEARGWKVDVRFRNAPHGKSFEVSARDSAGAPLDGLRLIGTFAAPADMALDRPVELERRAPGVYVGQVPVGPGNWDLELSAARGGETLFQSKNRIHLE